MANHKRKHRRYYSSCAHCKPDKYWRTRKDKFGGDSALSGVTPLKGTPSGDVEMVTFRLLGQDFMSISAGPVFRINPKVALCQK